MTSRVNLCCRYDKVRKAGFWVLGDFYEDIYVRGVYYLYYVVVNFNNLSRREIYLKNVNGWKNKIGLYSNILSRFERWMF